MVARRGYGSGSRIIVIILGANQTGEHESPVNHPMAPLASLVCGLDDSLAHEIPVGGENRAELRACKQVLVLGNR